MKLSLKSLSLLLVLFFVSSSAWTPIKGIFIIPSRFRTSHTRSDSLLGATKVNTNNNVKSKSPLPIILVIGATGKLGSRIVEKLDQRNIPYRCLVRPSSTNYNHTSLTSSSSSSFHGEIYEGDLANYNQVKEAVCSNGGISGVICVSGSFRKRKLSDFFRFTSKRNISDTSHPYIVNHIGMVNLCRAIEDKLMSQKPKIVKVSGVLLSLPKWHYITILGNFIYSGVINWHKEGEKVIINSGLPYTILRPGSFRNNLVGGKTIIDTDGVLKPKLKLEKPIIDIDNLADICIDCCLLNTTISDVNNKILYPRWIDDENI